MSRRRLALILVALSAGAGLLWFQTRGDDAPQRWRSSPVVRGPLRQVVSTTGTLEAVRSVDVGTQVSGILSEVLVDYNSPVTEGQIIARIDTSLLRADVDAAEARLDAAKATLAAAQTERKRAETLHGQSALSDLDLEVAQTTAAVAEADLESARVSLDRARKNLGYATITSPISGVVVNRAVDPGQTVNAGFSAPTLFTIAGDLSEMQIVAAVDEADIGQVFEGQSVRFHVAAWPEVDLTGKVHQIRLQPVVDSTIVTYQVVVRVDAPDKRLLPGMTATVDFVVSEVADALCAPNAALRFTPSTGEASAGKPGGSGGGSGGGPGGGSGGGRGRRKAGDEGSVWTLGPDGAPVKQVVKTGISDGKCTAIEGEGVSEGLEVLTGQDSSGSSGSSSPFQPSGASRSGPPRPGGI